MPVSTWPCQLDGGALALQHMHAPPDLFFTHCHLREASVNADGFLTAMAEYPSMPHSHPHVCAAAETHCVVGPLFSTARRAVSLHWGSSVRTRRFGCSHEERGRSDGRAHGPGGARRRPQRHSPLGSRGRSRPGRLSCLSCT